MWQRIQTVFLAIAIICLVASIFFPVWMYNDPLGQKHILTPLAYTVEEKEATNIRYMPYAITAILAIAAATIAIIGISKFKDRVLQMKLGALNSLFIAATIGSAFYFSNSLFKTFQGGGYGPGFWLP
jgi:CDP-diglyceride synthetase